MTWPTVRPTVSMTEFRNIWANGIESNTSTKFVNTHGSGMITGGTATESGNVLNAVRVCQMKGNTITTAPRPSTTCTIHVLRGVRRRPRTGDGDAAGVVGPATTARVDTSSVRVSSLIVHPLLLQAELHDGEDQDDDEQEEGDGRRVPALVVEEARLVEQVDDRPGVRHRRVVAAEHHVDEVEHLQRADHADDAHEEDARRQQRDRDREELAHGPGAVEVGRLH